MYQFWNTFIEPVFERLKPKVIVEIGSESGDNTSNLLEFCERNGGTLHVIEPFPKYDVSEWQQRHGEKLVFHRSLSLDALPEIDTPDVVLLDGDHNWYTVFHELKSIEKLSEGDEFPLVMLHDVGWPYARRDLYYDPDSIPEEYRNPFAKGGLSLGSNEVLEKGGINAHLVNAKHEGGAANGILTAVEDFVEQSEWDFEFRQVPGLHGLGILTPRQLREQNRDLAEFLDTLNSLTSDRGAEHIEKVERTRLEMQSALRGTEQREKALEREKREASKNVEQLVGWLEALDSEVTTILGSRRWKIGNVIGDLSQRKRPGREEPVEANLIRRQLEEFRAWKQKGGRPSDASNRAKAKEKPANGSAAGHTSPSATHEQSYDIMSRARRFLARVSKRAGARYWEPQYSLLQEELKKSRSPQATIRRFHQLYYDRHVWQRTPWMGIPALKLPFDLWAYQEILHETRPDLIVETGTAHGGSAMYLASICDLLGEGQIISIDVEERRTPNKSRPEHPRVRYVLGSSTDADLVTGVHEEARGKRTLVILDSDHSKAHVLNELQAYAPLVTAGGYLIVEDTNVNGHPVFPEHGPGPMEAVEEFLASPEGKGFEVDRSKEKFLFSFNPRGYLKRVG